MRLIRWSLLVIFVASLATAVIVRSTGYGVLAENGKYFVTYRSTRYQVAREDYEQTRWRNRVAGGAAATMMLSLFAFIGVNSLRLGGRHITRRYSG